MNSIIGGMLDLQIMKQLEFPFTKEIDEAYVKSQYRKNLLDGSIPIYEED